jgi:hypothetical protein
MDPRHLFVALKRYLTLFITTDTERHLQRRELHLGVLLLSLKKFDHQLTRQLLIMVQLFGAVGQLDKIRLRLLVFYYNLVKQIPNNKLLAASDDELPLLNFHFLTDFHEGAACLA